MGWLLKNVPCASGPSSLHYGAFRPLFAEREAFLKNSGRLAFPFPAIRFKGRRCLISKHILDLYYIIILLIDRRYINGSGHGSQREAKTGGKTPEDAAGNDEFGAQPKVLRLRPARPDLRQHDRGLVRLHVLLRHPVSHPPVYLCLSLFISTRRLCLKP